MKDDSSDPSDFDPTDDIAPADVHDGLAAVEAAIRAAKNYVVPSENLRPRTLEAAREMVDDRKQVRRFWRFSIGLLLCGALSIPLADRLNAWHQRSRSPSATELEWQALNLAESDSSIGTNWGLFEAFRQLRGTQAARFGRPSAPNDVHSSLQFGRFLDK